MCRCTADVICSVDLDPRQVGPQTELRLLLSTALFWDWRQREMMERGCGFGVCVVWKDEIIS